MTSEYISDPDYDKLCAAIRGELAEQQPAAETA